MIYIYYQNPQQENGLDFFCRSRKEVSYLDIENKIYFNMFIRGKEGRSHLFYNVHIRPLQIAPKVGIIMLIILFI